MSKRSDRQKFLDRIGLYPEDVDTWRLKWQRLKDGVKDRCECLLTFEEYVLFAKESDIARPEQIGTSRDSYQMGRIGDKGNYEVGNCRFILKSQNQLEAKLNGGTARMAQSKIGLTKQNSEGVARGALKQSKRFKLISPHGTVYEGIGLSQFCEDMGLNRGEMCSVCAGKTKQHKGWTGEYL